VSAGSTLFEVRGKDPHEVIAVEVHEHDKYINAEKLGPLKLN